MLTASIADLKKQMEKASQNREAENKAGVFCFDVLGRFSSSESEWRFQEFQTLVTEQRETQRLLKDALTALKEFYMKNPAGFLSTLGRTSLSYLSCALTFGHTHTQGPRVPHSAWGLSKKGNKQTKGTQPNAKKQVNSRSQTS